jgi:16S rRNA processing protein RimM
MIVRDEVFRIGRLIKPHGIKGEISFAFDSDVFDRVDCPYLICLLDGIFVPFFIEEYRFKGRETALMKFEGIDSEEKARRLSGADVYFPRSYMDSAEKEPFAEGWSYFIGFSLTDSRTGHVGVIEAVDESTLNTLFLVKRGEDEIIIPATENLIDSVDDKGRTLQMNLPDGLL